MLAAGLPVQREGNGMVFLTGRGCNHCREMANDRDYACDESKRAPAIMAIIRDDICERRHLGCGTRIGETE